MKYRVDLEKKEKNEKGKRKRKKKKQEGIKREERMQFFFGAMGHLPAV